jgi:hypothetical protein
MYSIYRQCVAGGGGVDCTVDHILFLTRFRTYKIVSPPQTKMTSKDDIKGLVSLKFLRPCCDVTGTTRPAASTLGRSAGSCSRAPSLHMRRNTTSGQYSYMLCSLIFSSILSVSRSLYSLILLSSLLSYPLCYLLFSPLCSPLCSTLHFALLSEMLCYSHCSDILFSAVLSALHRYELWSQSFPSCSHASLLLSLVSFPCICSPLLPALLCFILCSAHCPPLYLLCPLLFSHFPSPQLSSMFSSPICSANFLHSSSIWIILYFYSL